LKNNIILIFLIFFLTGCADYLAERERIREQNRKLEYERQVQNDRSTCIRYGFTPNTSEFSNCLMKIDVQRKAILREQKRRECQEVRRSNAESGVGGFWGGVLMGARENMACD
jgi:hypothetical protein